MEQAEGEQHRQERLTPIVSLDFRDPKLASLPVSVRLRQSMNTLNQMAAVTEFGRTQEDTSRKKDILKELDDHFKIVTASIKDTPQPKTRHSLTELVEASGSVMKDLPAERTNQIQVPVRDELEVRVMGDKLLTVQHNISKVFTMVGVIDDPRFAALFQDIDHYYLRLGNYLAEAPNYLMDVYDKEPILTPTFARRIAAQMEVLFRGGIRPSNISEMEEIVEVQQQEALKNLNVEFSDAWLATIGEDFAQNINRATKNNHTTKVKIASRLSPDNQSVIFSVANTNSQFPPEILEHGFLEGVGTNEGGEHIGMARLTKIIREQYGGDLRAKNIKDEDGAEWAVVELQLPVK